MLILKTSTIGFDKEDPKLYRVLLLNEDGSIAYDKWIKDHASLIKKSDILSDTEAIKIRSICEKGTDERTVLSEVLQYLKDNVIAGLYVGYDANAIIKRVNALGIVHDLKSLTIKDLAKLEYQTHPYDRLPMSFDAIMSRYNIDYGNKYDAGHYALSSLCLYKKLKSQI